jgi:NhaP-type Na+/H+ or K+/H+ antiporter
MNEHILFYISMIIALGMIAQWLAWRLRLPSILILLIFGFAAGPVTGFIHPDELFGELLFPIISGAVAMILFEGGMSLKFSEVRQTGHVVINLATIGALVSWLLSAAGIYFILGFDLPIALLMGAILVVTGPTVIGPLLRHVQATGRVSSIIKWESIVNDPIGALLAVLVFEAIVARGVQSATIGVVISLLETILIGVVLAALGAAILVILLKNYWIPDYLQNGVTLMLAIGTFTLSNMIQEEAGLFTVTLMGIILSNQKYASIKHIVEFKENLRVLLLATLFIILAARVQVTDLAHLGMNSAVFLLILIFLIRPLSVWASTIKSGLTWREKVFIAWMAPRGIVAAAVSAVFALELVEQAGYAQAELMVAEMFVIIVGTVTVYGLTAAPVGRWLKVAQPNPQGVMIVGGHAWGRAIAAALRAEGFKVLVIDTNRNNISAARLNGLPTHCASILSEYIIDEVELGGLGRLLALTSNDEVNSLAALHFTETFGRAGVFQLAPKQLELKRRESVSQPLRGRLLFHPQATFTHLDEWFNEGAIVKSVKLTSQFTYADFQKFYGDKAIPMFLIHRSGDLETLTAESRLAPQPGQTLISIVEPTNSSFSVSKF